jgi:hypothetical protein
MRFKLEDDTMFMDSLTTEIRNLEQEGNQWPLTNSKTTCAIQCSTTTTKNK